MKVNMFKQSRLWALYLCGSTVALFSPLGCKHAPIATTLSHVEKNSTRAVLGEGDVIEVRVFGEGELSGKHQVSSDGTIRLPLVGSISVRGLTPEETAGYISEEYRKAYVRQPEVSVFVEEFNSRKVFVLGEVKNPGPYTFEENMTVIAAVAKAGGTSALAAPNRTVVSHEHEGKQVRVIARVADIGRGEAPDMVLQPGDIVFVPESIF
jgi:protein involved in polysaccharide export with SLBB domain